MEKKADVSVQFNWIFIIIIGAIILTFFLSIVNKQKEQSDIKISANVVTAFKTILQASIVKERSTQLISMPKYDMEFYCELDTCTTHGCYSGYRVKGSPLDISSDLMSIFSPDILKGRKMITYSFDWNMPFKVLNILIVTSDQARYVFINDSSEYSFFREIVPENITSNFINSSQLSSIKDENFYKTRYVFFNSEKLAEGELIPDMIVSTKESNVTVLNIKFSSRFAGSVEYYNSNAAGISLLGKVNFFDNTTLLAAIFSENSNIYNCNMIKAFNRLQRLSEVYSLKIKTLEEQYYGQTTGCGPVFYSKTSADKLKTVSRSIISNKEIITEDITELNTAFNDILRINKRARDFSCPVIY